MKILAMKFCDDIRARASLSPEFTGSRRRAGCSPRAWSQRQWLSALRDLLNGRSFQPHPATGASSHARLRYMPTSALSFLTAFLQAGLF
jgi:hypothetical protein